MKVAAVNWAESLGGKARSQYAHEIVGGSGLKGIGMK